jgi:hypothetical protein
MWFPAAMNPVAGMFSAPDHRVAVVERTMPRTTAAMPR